MNDLFTATGCPLCGSTRLKYLFPIDNDYARHLSGFDVSSWGVGVNLCGDCAHQFIHPRPGSEFLKAFYSSYMSLAKDGFYKDRRAAEIPEHFRGRYAAHIRDLKHLAPTATSLLDVGAGLGMFMRLANEFGYTCTGVEPNAEAAETVRRDHGIDVIPSLFEEAELDRRFDVITMWDLLEHLSDVRANVARAAAALRPGGMLVLEIPARDSFVHRLAKSLYRLSFGRIRRPLFLVCGIHHLHYFSSASIREFLNECGFEIELLKRGSTDISTRLRKVEGSLSRRLKTSLHNLSLEAMFSAARITGSQNKLIVFARLKP